MIWVINWEYKWVLWLFWLFKSYKILHVECDIWPVDSVKSCGRASNMATGLYAVSYTITHGSSVLHRKVQTVDAESETFNSLFKSSKSVDGYRIVDVCVAASQWPVGQYWCCWRAACVQRYWIPTHPFQGWEAGGRYVVSKCIKRNYTV